MLDFSEVKPRPSCEVQVCLGRCTVLGIIIDLKDYEWTGSGGGMMYCTCSSTASNCKSNMFSTLCLIA